MSKALKPWVCEVEHTRLFQDDEGHGLKSTEDTWIRSTQDGSIVGGVIATHRPEGFPPAKDDKDKVLLDQTCYRWWVENPGTTAHALSVDYGKGVVDTVLRRMGYTVPLRQQ